MTRLPSRLQPLWPAVKRAHRLATRTSGSVGRRTRWAQGERPLPARGTSLSAQTAALEPETVRLHVGATGERIDRAPALGSPAGHWVFAKSMQYDVAPPFCLEITDGITTGPDGTNITPGGILDYETSQYFGLSGWKEHPLFLRRRLPEITDVDGTVVSLAARAAGRNYYHFLTDALPRFGVLEEVMPDVQVDAIYVPAHAKWQRAFLELAGLGHLTVIPAAEERAVRARRLIAPSLTNIAEIAPSSTVSWVRKRLPAADVSDKPRRIYVSRGSAPRSRRVDDEAALLPMLEQRGFVSVSPERLTPQEQIDLFAAAEVVVAPHGAALTNLLWLNPGARVLELFHPAYVNAAFWSITQTIGDIDHRYLVGEGAERFGPGSPMNRIQADIAIPATRIVEAVDELLA